jgi:hypothetical protein
MSESQRTVTSGIAFAFVGQVFPRLQLVQGDVCSFVRNEKRRRRGNPHGVEIPATLSSHEKKGPRIAMNRSACFLYLVKGATVLAAAISLVSGSAAWADMIVTSGSQYTTAYNYYTNNSNNTYPYNSSTTNGLTTTTSQTDSGNYSDPSYENASGGATAAQTVSPLLLNVYTAADAYANPVNNGDYAYTYSEADETLNFTLTTDTIIEFTYDTVANTTASGNGYDYGYGYGQSLYNADGTYYYAFAYSYGGGGPYSAVGSITLDLAAGSYTLSGQSYAYSYAYTGYDADATAFNSITLNVVPEPSAMVLFGCGGLLAFGYGYSHRRRSWLAPPAARSEEVNR